MNERTILQHVHDLVEEERALRQSAGGDGSERLIAIEQELDQCWDLLRQRRSKREFGDNPDEAAPRDISTIENYEG
jgi:hypothetical protein